MSTNMAKKVYPGLTTIPPKPSRTRTTCSNCQIWCGSNANNLPPLFFPTNGTKNPDTSSLKCPARPTPAQLTQRGTPWPRPTRRAAPPPAAASPPPNAAPRPAGSPRHETRGGLARPQVSSLGLQGKRLKGRSEYKPVFGFNRRQKKQEKLCLVLKETRRTKLLCVWGRRPRRIRHPVKQAFHHLLIIRLI